MFLRASAYDARNLYIVLNSKKMKFFLTIAASDNSGGAGIQQDIKVAYDLNYWSLSAITGLTVQNFKEAKIIEPVNSDLLFAQIYENLLSFDVKTVKIGALTSSENIKAVVKALNFKKPEVIVLDPVLATSSGKEFLSVNDLSLLIEELFPLITVLTPNALELEIISGQEIKNFYQAMDLAKKLSKQWNMSIIVKGGHFNEEHIKEAVIDKAQTYICEHKRWDFSRYSHGTGCTFSTALACYLGDGLSLKKAYERATQYLLDFYERMQTSVKS